ncbi:MAG: hypothetical protein Q6373_005540 [Candidatus Sigynarchaeota archaeon]
MLGARVSVGMHRRPLKRPAGEICRELGFEGVDDFLVYMDSLPVPYHVGEGNPDPDEFTVRAFPEFPASAPSEANRKGNRSGLSGRDMRNYVAAYELTYKYHYEMQDDWHDTLVDPDLHQYLFVPAHLIDSRLGRQATIQKWLRPPGTETTIPFDMFEGAMLCVADDGYWTHEVHEVARWLDFRVAVAWICYWRHRLGRPVVHGVDDDPDWHALVWRDNWQAVRDEVAALHAETYPADDPANEYERRDMHWLLYPGHSVDAAVAALADRLAREAGWPEEPYETRRRQPGCWSEATLRVAARICTLAAGPWHDYIEAKSGRPVRLSGWYLNRY